MKKGELQIMKNNLISDDYKDFIGKIKNKIRSSQYEAMKQVNRTLINLYWGIGQEIYNQQQEKGWGKSIVEVLSKELKKEFPDVQGFSSRNLWRMRNLYVEYKDNEFLPPLVAEISWSKNVAIMEKCKDQLERELEESLIIIICKNKNRTVVEYALNDSDKPIGIATYKIRDTLPEKMKDLLPSPEEIKKRLEGLE